MSDADRPVDIDARGMRCPWPALRAARAMRSARAVVIRADDPVAGRELAVLADERGWAFEGLDSDIFCLRRADRDTSA